MSSFRCKNIAVNIVLLIAVTIIFFVLMELVLRMVLPNFVNYYVWRPHLSTLFKPLPQFVPGVEGDSRFITNAVGLRGDELSSQDDLRLLAIGGSTTECLYLDQDETWPALLQQHLSNEDWRVWVGNAGKSGITSYEHGLQIHELLRQIPDVNMVLILLGVNDFIDYLAFGKTPVLTEQEILEPSYDASIRAFDVLPRYADTRLPWFKRTRIWFLMTKVMYRYSFRRDVQDRAGEIYQNSRVNRQSAHFLQEMPDLTSGFEQYRRNLSFILQEARSRDVRIIFLTQPFLWHEHLSSKEESLLWFGWASPEKWNAKNYYSAPAMQSGMRQYNEILMQFCRDEQVECFDLASLIPQNMSMFYDDVHFTEAGAKYVADLIGSYLGRAQLNSASQKESVISE